MAESMPEPATDDTDEPLLRVMRGNPTTTELAALVLAVRARVAESAADASPSSADQTRRPANWAAYWRSVRQPPRTGLDAWRASVHPTRGTGW